jgi:CheY-like chemotaxis protein
LEILIAEDDMDTLNTYRMVLEDRGHHVLVADNGERCLEIYNEKLHNIRLNHPSTDVQPFDVVILDHRMPRIYGLDVAKEILAVFPRQRILLVSAYVNVLEESARQYLEHHVEILQKPVDIKMLADTIEDNAIYSELEKLGLDVKLVKAANFTHSQLLLILEFLKKHEKK